MLELGSERGGRNERGQRSDHAERSDRQGPGARTGALERTRTLLDRVGDILSSFGRDRSALCHRVRASGAGRHVLLGFEGQAPFARVTALGAMDGGGSSSYGLSFQGGVERKWELLLVDDLSPVIEHALIGGGALD